MRIIICLALIALATATPTRFRRGIVQQEEADEKAGEEGSSGYHHEVEHEHAKSHQTIKFHHFHPVPVYVKKEHQHLLKHPLEKGASAHNLKQIHPKTEHQHSYGLVLENHGYDHGIHGRSDDHAQDEHSAGLEQASEGGEGGEGESHGESEGWSHAEDSAPVYETKSFQEDHYQYDPSEQKSGHEESY